MKKCILLIYTAIFLLSSCKKNRTVLHVLTIAFIGLLALSSCSKSNEQKAPDKSSEKAILSFSFKNLTPEVIGTINGNTITLTVLPATNITALVPAISISKGAKVSPDSGVQQDFSKNVSYIVTAEDGSTQTYTVIVNRQVALTKTIDCTNVPTILEDLGDGIDYIVKCNIPLTNNKVLNIKPGVKIQFEGTDAGFTITNGGALKMLGTAANPIILQGKTDAGGTWTGIQLASNNIDNQWEHVTIQNAGAGKYPAALLIADSYLAQNATSTQIALKNCTFKNNTGYGIWEYDNKYIYPRIIFNAFEKNTFTNNSLSALKVTIDAVGKLDAQSSYTNNGQKFIEVTGLNGLHNNTTVKKLEVPYLINDLIFLYQKLIVSPGITLKFNIDAGLAISTGGTLIAKGTATEQIQFIGKTSGKGYWGGLFLNSNDPEIALSYCTIDGAGSNQFSASPGACLYPKAAVSLRGCANYSYSTTASVTNCTISNSGGYGITYKQGSGVAIKNNTYSGNTAANEISYKE